MKIRTRKNKYIVRFRKQWVWGTAGTYRFLGCFVVERRVRGFVN